MRRLVFLSVLAATSVHAAPPAPPVARKYPYTTTLHGEKRQDDYFWLREKADPKVRAYLEAEDHYAIEMMKPTEAFQERLYQEMKGRIKENDVNVPYHEHGWFWTSRVEEGKQYPIFIRKKSLEAADEVVIDTNELAKGKAFMSVTELEPTDDGDLLAYRTDDVGFRQYELHLKDLRTGKVLPDTAPRVTSLAWAADGKTLFYTQETPDTKRTSRLYRHILGQPPEQDTLIYEEKDELFDLGVGRTLDGKYLVLGISSHTTSESRVLPAATPLGAFQVFLPRVQDVEYDLEHGGELFYIRINDQGRNFRLCATSDKDTRPQAWKELVPHRDDVMLEAVTVFAGYVVRQERADAVPHLVVADLKSGAAREVKMPEPVYSAELESNSEFDTTKVRYSYESLTTPRTILDHDMAAGTSAVLKRYDVVGAYDPNAYQSERTHAKAADGTMIPVSIVYKKGLKKDGRSPLLLEAYGSYGIPYDVGFSTSRLSYLDRGVVYAIAHIRGGGDLGKKWHDDGRMLKKMNTFTDFIAAAEHLIGSGYTSRDRLVIEGGSAGGLLMGAVLNLRPDLWKAVVAHVPFVDVLNTMLDDSLPLTAGEFEEWGNPEVKAEFDVMRKYSPYDNVTRKPYPAMLVKTGWSDSQVMYWEPAKWVARLRALKTDRNPLLLKVNFSAGHGGASGRYDKIREAAFDAAFVLTRMGIHQ